MSKTPENGPLFLSHAYSEVTEKSSSLATKINTRPGSNNSIRFVEGGMDVKFEELRSARVGYDWLAKIITSDINLQHSVGVSL